MNGSHGAGTSTRAPRGICGSRQRAAGVPSPTRRDVLALLAAAMALPARAQPARPHFRLALADDEPVPFRGIARFDDAGVSSPNILYPAPNLVGLLAAVLTHAAIVDSEKSVQKMRLQQEADKVLERYRTTLDGYRLRQLRESAAPALAAHGVDAAPADAESGLAAERLESVPMFAITPDETALVLENVLRVAAPPGRPEANALSVRVVSAPLVPAGPAGDAVVDPAAAWVEDDGRRLKGLCAELFAESIALALIALDPSAAPAQPQMRTFRYMQGREERFERGQLQAARPGRLVLRTLRGQLLSVPEQPATPASPAASLPAG